MNILEEDICVIVQQLEAEGHPVTPLLMEHLISVSNKLKKCAIQRKIPTLRIPRYFAHSEQQSEEVKVLLSILKVATQIDHTTLIKWSGAVRIQ